jgi:teichuronic acid biosynthesis glycosyltransferase TuaC
MRDSEALPMRLLFISNLFPDTDQPWRGLDNVTLLHAMRGQRPEADIRVLCLRPGHGFWKGSHCGLKPRPGDEVFQPIYGWAPYVPKFGGMNDRLFAMAVRRALAKLPPSWKPDALLVPWLFPDGCGVNRVHELAGVPMVSVAQGSDVHQYLALATRRRAILSLAKRARIITRSEDLRQRLLRAGADAGQVRTVYNGVDTEMFYPGETLEARLSLNLPKDGKLLLFVGNFLPVKGLDLLIKATALAAREMSVPLRLVMIGSGPLQQELATLAKQEGLPEDALIWAGRRPPAEVAQFMRCSDAVCLSSHNEGVPNVLLESLASGRAFVTTDVGGISEILDSVPGGSGRGGLVAGREPAIYASTLLRVLISAPSAEALSQYAATLAWPQCAEVYWQEVSTKIK